jgi:ribonuclease HI
MSVAAVIRGVVDRRDAIGVGSSGDAEWLALLHGLDVALAAGEVDVILLGDSAGTIDQAQGRARKRCAPEVQMRFDALCARFARLRFRRIKRNQNLAGIALDHVRHRSPQ